MEPTNNRPLASLTLSLVLLGAGTFASGCSSTATVIKHPFPKASTLDAIAARPAPDTSASMREAPLAVSTWQLEGPFPDGAGASALASGGELESGVGARIKAGRPGVTLTRGMQCFAREYGRFLGAHGKRPQLDLQAYMAGRCGVVSANQAVTLMLLDASEPLPPVDDGAIDTVVNSIPDTAGGGELGAWLGSGDKHHVLVSAFGTPRVDLSRVERGPSTVQIAGKVLGATGWLRGHATVGALGFSTCEPTPGSTARLPAFDLSCVVDDSDPSAAIDMLAGAPDAILGDRVLNLVVPLADAVSSTYKVATMAGDTERGGLVAQLNAVRAGLSLPALVDVPAQSEIARALLPHYFAAISTADQQTADDIALGLMAGWRVEGPIRDAGFASFIGRRGDHTPSLLAELIYFPSTRSTLLNPEATKLALATVDDRQSTVTAGYVTTYTLFEDRRYVRYEKALLDELDRQRAGKGIGPVERVGGPNTDKELDPTMTKLSKGEITPADGMDRALSAYATKLQREFRGYTLGTMVIDGWMPSFPADLLETEKVAVTARLGYYTAESTSWGQYVVYLIYTPL
ncbi:MAG: hypothetical protein GY946_07330 [bacterium]|nr:hypothetical protein [bacterium]